MVARSSALLAFACLFVALPAAAADPPPDPALVERVRQGVACVDAGEMTCAIDLLVPIRDTGEDSMMQAVVHYSLGVAYRSSGRAVDAIDMYLAVLAMKSTPPAQRKQSREALDELLAPDASEVDPKTERVVERLSLIEQQRDPPPPWRSRLAYARGSMHEALGQYERAIEVFMGLARHADGDPALARRARARADDIARAHVAEIIVPCIGSEEVYFTIQPLGVRGSVDAGEPVGRGALPQANASMPADAQCINCWHRCSNDAIAVRPGRHGVVIWERSEAAAEQFVIPVQRAVEAQRGRPIEISYLLEAPQPPARFSPIGVLTGGTLVVAGMISNIAAATEGSDAALTGAVVGYAAGGALLLGELARFVVDHLDRRQQAAVSESSP